MNCSGENNWILVILDEPLSYAGKSFTHILTKPKAKGNFKTGGKKQHAELRLVEFPSVLVDGTNDKKNYPFIEWVIVEIKKA